MLVTAGKNERALPFAMPTVTTLAELEKKQPKHNVVTTTAVLKINFIENVMCIRT
jgi:hypothetical protein